MKKIIGILVIICLIGLLGWQIYQRVQEYRATNAGNGGAPGGQSGGRSRPAVTVEIAEVQQKTIQDIGQFTGSLLPTSQFIVTPKVSGRIEQLLVNIGDRVERGQLIAKLDDEAFRQAVDKAKAELEVAKANLVETQSALEITRRDFERAKTLSQSNILSQSNLDMAEAKYNAAVASQKVARATVTNRQSGLDTAKLNLSYTEITADWNSGSDTRVVGERFVDEGAILKANDSIVSLLDLSTIISEINVIERDYFRIRQGQEAVIMTDAFPGTPFIGKVARIAPLLQEQSRQARVEIEIPNPEELLKPGMFVRVRLQFENIENATVVPMSALVKREEQQGVFVADTNNMTARFVPVTVGVTSNGLVQILDPSLSGAVVTLGHHLLEDGATIALPEQASGGPQAEQRRQGSQPTAP
ncbi:efflux transporter, RND family, MFP subunit [Candidatus Vecturithrix granuli]|uniref:Efflux transporter, RND family, MFP subunit n=1 Tax=Vecturithrix granuli TaxID=1499967 RepID=A0A081C678_VECG1|nr:efflux transporter, RND family, MFP subunit [Candidatus Vecturithrix granuli]